MFSLEHEALRTRLIIASVNASDAEAKPALRMVLKYNEIKAIAGPTIHVRISCTKHRILSFVSISELIRSRPRDVVYDSVNVPVIVEFRSFRNIRAVFF